MSTNTVVAMAAYHGDSEQEAIRLRAEAQAKLAAIIESSDDAIISKTLDGVIRTWYEGGRIFGFTADEAVGKPMLIIIPPDRHSEEPDVSASCATGSGSTITRRFAGGRTAR